MLHFYSSWPIDLSRYLDASRDWYLPYRFTLQVMDQAGNYQGVIGIGISLP